MWTFGFYFLVFYGGVAFFMLIGYCIERIVIKISAKRSYNKRILDIRDLWGENKITHKYGENFTYISPKTYPNQLKGYYIYIFSSNNYQTGALSLFPEDALLFFFTIKYELNKIKYKFTKDESKVEFEVPDKDYDLLRQLFNHLKQNSTGPAVSASPINSTGPINVVLSTKDRFDILDFNK